MASLSRRIRDLEGLQCKSACLGCGWGGDDFGPNDSYELTWVDPGGPEDKEEWCESCGRQLVIHITWGDDAP